MENTIYIKFEGTKSAWNKQMLTKIGHTDYIIDEIHTFRDSETADTAGCVAVTCFVSPTDKQISSIRDKVAKILRVSEVVTNDSELDNLFTLSKNKEPGTKLKFWFKHATFVSPGLSDKV